MSNRLLGILIIIGFIGALTLFYLYFFVYYIGNINIQSNVADYQVKLYASEIKTTKNYDCPKQECILDKTSPFNYTLTISKEGYKTIKQIFKMGKNEQKQILISLEKNILLEKINTPNIRLEEATEESINEKIQEIKRKNEFLRIDVIPGIGEFTWEGKDKITLKKNGIKISDFNFTGKEKDLNIKTIIEDENNIFIQVGNNSYIYNLKYKVLSKINITFEINTLKKSLNNSEFIFTTSKGVFLYDIHTQKLQYIQQFSDLIYYKDGYLGIIYADDNTKLTNFGIKEKNKNIILYYNTKTNTKTIIYSTDKKIKYIQNKGDKIILIDNERKEFYLENL